jgi:hypothetical protein
MATCYRIAYSSPVRRGRAVQAPWTRDGESSLFIADAVRALGYEYGGPLFQFPAVDGRGDPIVPRKRRAVAVDVPEIGPDDLLLLNTRPPLDDEITGDRLAIDRSYTELECRLFTDDGPLRRWFLRCARSEMILSNNAADVSGEIRQRQRMWFRQHGGATYQSYAPLSGEWTYPKKSDVRTPAFLVFAEEAWRGGPKLLATFGMGSTPGLVWAYLLATRFSDLLLTTEFAMAELQGPWPQCPSSMAFADDCPVTILGAAPILKAA